MNRFSKRFGHIESEKEITIREDAPDELRQFIIQLIYDFRYPPSFLREVICRTLKVLPDRDNWSEYPNIAGEAENLLIKCEWFQVYDIIEAFWDRIDQKFREEYSNEINEFFKHKGIGWKIEHGQIETRGDKVFENSVFEVENVLKNSEMPTAHAEYKEAILDLSRRPKPDITGAIQHSLACIECVCRDITGNPKATLGELIKRYPDIVPKPLDSAIEKIWGFSSEQGRHLREGHEPNYEEAELLVQLVSAFSSYLVKKHKSISEDNDLPF